MFLILDPYIIFYKNFTIYCVLFNAYHMLKLYIYIIYTYFTQIHTVLLCNMLYFMHSFHINTAIVEFHSARPLRQDDTSTGERLQHVKVLQISTETGHISTFGSTAEGRFKWSRGLLARNLWHSVPSPQYQTPSGKHWGGFTLIWDHRMRVCDINGRDL